MADGHEAHSSSDFNRYGRRLKGYLLALDQIAETLDSEKAGKLSEAEVDNLLRQILPGLYQAFNSEMAFVADKAGKISFGVPEGNHLVDKSLNLPDAPHAKALMADGKPLVIAGDVKVYPELRALAVQSLLVVRLVTPWGLRFVGVCNGRNEPAPYLSEDEHFLNDLMSMLTISLYYGASEKERQFASDRYFWARLRGEWDYLSRASEDYAQAHLNWSQKGDRPRPNLYDRARDDDLLADYLDAELSRVLRMLPSASIDDQVSTGRQKLGSLAAPTSEPKPTDKPEPAWETLLELCRAAEDGEHFWVYLRDNDAWTPASEPLEPTQYPRSAIAVARICLSAGYLKARARVPPKDDTASEIAGETFAVAQASQSRGLVPAGNADSPAVSKDEPKADAPEKDLSSASPAWLYGVLAKRLLQNTKPRKKVSKDPYYFERQVDWLRARWQQMHYLARDDAPMLLGEKVEKIDHLYAAAWPLTVQVLQSHLEAQLARGDLCVDSDWLITWLASNALLSKRLGDYYGLIPSGKPGQPVIASPAARMRYIMHLSQHVLYALHYIRHARRRKDFQEFDRSRDQSKHRSKYAAQFRRPAFADVPVGLTGSLSEAQLYILSEYAYREIGVHRELLIFERLARQFRYELPLHAASSFYRDHLYHVMDVCLLGELLLRSAPLPKDGAARQDSLAESIARNARNSLPDQLLQNWYVAALCHDLGYVIEQAGKLLEPIGNIKGDGLDDFVLKTGEGLKNGEEAIRHTLEQAAHAEPSGTLSNALTEALEKGKPTDHGIAAYLHLCRWLKQVQPSPISLDHALTAILRHNLPDQKVNIAQEPLTLLLMLCDHLQEWGRPRVGPDLLARGVMEAMRFSEQAEFEKKVRARQLLVRGLKPVRLERKAISQRICERCANTSDCADQCFRIQTRIEESGLEFTLPHIESREGDFEPVISWLLLCRDLQCLGSPQKKLPYHITIILKHTPPRIWNLLPWRPLEMDLLQDFANIYERAAYLCEWVELARNGKKGIQYEGYRETGVETFTVKLHELDHPLRHGLSDEHWQSFYHWKWQRLGHQFLAMNLGAWFPEL